MKRISIVLLMGLAMVAGGAQAAGKTGFYAGGGVSWTQYKTEDSVDLLSSTSTNQQCLAMPAPNTTTNPDTILAYNNSPAACLDYFSNGQGSFNESAIGLGAFIGWEFIPNWSVELQYVWLGEADRTDLVGSDPDLPQGGLLQPPRYKSNEELAYKQDFEATALNLVGRYHWAMSPKWGFNFAAGWTFAKGKYAQSSDNIQEQNQSAVWYRPPASAQMKESDNGYLLGFGATIDTTENTFLRIEYMHYGVDFNGLVKAPNRLGFDAGYRF
ncbi:MAG: outer membrane beta-barrel protein [Chromatiales bacterium]|nr:outer membrane beta-barrel protein [Chromatiales bacterium]